MKQIKENKPDILEQALGSLEGMQRATPREFFYTRLQARMLNRKISFWDKFEILLTRPAVVVGGLCLIVLINIFAVFDQSSKLAATNESSPELSLVEEYTIASNSLFDYENIDIK